MNTREIEDRLFSYWMENYPEEVGCKDDSIDNFDNWLEREGIDGIKPLVEHLAGTKNPDIINPVLTELGY